MVSGETAEYRFWSEKVLDPYDCISQSGYGLLQAGIY
jgi:hypothetical protein